MLPTATAVSLLTRSFLIGKKADVDITLMSVRNVSAYSLFSCSFMSAYSLSCCRCMYTECLCSCRCISAYSLCSL